MMKQPSSVPEMMHDGRQTDCSKPPLPVVSVITTLLYPRERPLECLVSWTSGQQLPREQIELIIVINGRRGALERQVGRILREQDRVIMVDSPNEMALYDAGARAARGEWLMFTEPHCVAEPDCLPQLLDLVRSGNLAGACVRTMPSDDPAKVARMEARMYLEEAETWTSENDWRKFTKRGTLLSKAAYEDAGGFDPRLLRYGETALAARLHQIGHRLGFAPKAAITHYNSRDLSELLGYVWEYRRQEVLAASNAGTPTFASSGAEADPDLSESMKNAGFRQRLRSTLRKPLRKALATLSAPDSRTMLGTWGALLLPSWSWSWWSRAMAIAKPAAVFAGSLLRFYWPNQGDGALYACFRRIWQTFGDLSVATMWKRPPNRPEHEPLPAGMSCTLAMVDRSRITGFHAVEQLHGVPFSWSGTTAVLRYQASSGIPTVTLNILPVRPLKARRLTVLWNKTRLSYLKAESSDSRWVYGLKAESKKAPPTARQSEDWLVLLCPPLPAQPADSRTLGLPVTSVELDFRTQRLASVAVADASVSAGPTV